MTGRRIALLALGPSALLVALWLLSPDGVAPDAIVTPPSASSSSPVDDRIDGAAQPPSAPPSGEPAATGETTAPRSEPPPTRRESHGSRSRLETLITGRFVDAEGHPVADVRCTLEEHRDRDRVEAWERRHGSLHWEAPEGIRSGLDGRIALRLWAPAPFAWDLSITPDRRVSLNIHWDHLPSGTVDLGDVTLPKGAYVRGKVQDTDGFFPPGLRTLTVHPITLGAGGHGVPIPERSCTIEFGGTGLGRALFSSDRRVPAGLYELQLPEGFRFASGDQTRRLQVTDGMEPVELVLRGTPPERTIRGIVVDAQGSPRKDVTVSRRSGSASGAWTRTDSDGHFTLRRDPQNASERYFPLRLSGAGLEDSTTEEFYSWGDHDVRLVARPGATLRLEVMREGSPRPVEHYGVSLQRVDNHGSGFRTITWRRARGGWDHPQGKMTLPGLNRGRYEVRIIPDENTPWGAAHLQTVEIRGDEPIVLQVWLPATKR